jgi:hypothetical protein
MPAIRTSWEAGAALATILAGSFSHALSMGRVHYARRSPPGEKKNPQLVKVEG